MTAFSAYGTNTCTPAERAQLVAARLDLTFVERESDYCVAKIPPEPTSV